MKNESDTQTIKRLSQQFPKLLVVGERLGSYAYYIADQMRLAEHFKAPPNTTHISRDGVWKTS